jgi:hypothetical protein
MELDRTGTTGKGLTLTVKYIPPLQLSPTTRTMMRVEDDDLDLESVA